MLIVADTGFMLRGASRDELLATIPDRPGAQPKTIRVTIGCVEYSCTVKYYQ